VKALLVIVVMVIGVMPMLLMLAIPAVLVEFPWAVIEGLGPINGGGAPAPSIVRGPLPAPPPPGAPVPGVIGIAETWLGTPYVFGGCSRSGVDCSCFVELAFAAIGVSLPRTAQEQWDATARVDQAELQPGDLVFFAHTYRSVDAITHVGIYLGGGMQINAPDTGQVVSIQPVFTGFWGAHLAGGGRPRR
jgi:cell wall-associated NlpC family hydrolase